MHYHIFRRHHLLNSVIVFLSLFLFQKLNGQGSANNLTMVIEDFQKDNQLDWRIINDGVMGGISSSKIDIKNDGIAEFSGNVSLENYGGFASVRALLFAKDMTGILKIQIRVKGDGKKYDFRIRTNKNFDGVSYRVDFLTKKNEWSTHDFLLSDFVPTFRGRNLKNVPPIVAKEIKQVGILIADKQEGKFKLMIDYVKGILHPSE